MQETSRVFGWIIPIYGRHRLAVLITGLALSGLLLFICSTPDRRKAQAKPHASIISQFGSDAQPSPGRRIGSELQISSPGIVEFYLPVPFVPHYATVELDKDEADSKCPKVTVSAKCLHDDQWTELGHTTIFRRTRRSYAFPGVVSTGYQLRVEHTGFEPSRSVETTATPVLLRICSVAFEE